MITRLIRPTDPSGSVIFFRHVKDGEATIKGKLICQWDGFCWVSWDNAPTPETHPSFNILIDASSVDNEVPSCQLKNENPSS